MQPEERARHEAFIWRQLLSSFAIMAVAPVYLACYGAPAPWHALVFAWGILPLCAVTLVVRSGDLVLAQGLGMASFVGLATTLAAGGQAWQMALAWLALAPLEGMIAQDRRLVVTGAGVALAGLFGLLAAGAFGWLALGFAAAPAALFVAPAIIASAALATILLAQQRVRVAALDAALRRQMAVYEACGDLVLHYDAQGAADYVGSNCEALFGVPQRRLIGRGLFEHIHVADRPAFLKSLAEAANGTTTVQASLRLRAGSDRDEPGFRVVELRARRADAPAAAGRPSPVIAMLRDVTDIRQQSEELDAVRGALREHELWKDQFLANVSHELRTPLNAIIGFAEMLGNPQLAPQQPERRREYAHIIHESGQHLLSVVNSILDMSKIQSGTFTIVPEAFDIAPLIDLCCDMVRLKAQENEIELVRAFPPRLDEIVGDQRACKQILINLLSNAVKFTPTKGRVTIDVRPDGNFLLISVADTGIGIAARDLARLGDPFFQAGAAYDRPYEGTGLGLSVVRGLVGLHGGTMAVESELGKGTCVTVRLPLDCRQIAGSRARQTKIETISRRSRRDEVKSLNPDMMVKKIA